MPAAAKGDCWLARQVPFFTVGVLQDNGAFYPQRAIGANSNLDYFF
jgi:hypothetical protein